MASLSWIREGGFESPARRGESKIARINAGRQLHSRVDEDVAACLTAGRLRSVGISKLADRTPSTSAAYSAAEDEGPDMSYVVSPPDQNRAVPHPACASCSSHNLPVRDSECCADVRNRRVEGRRRFFSRLLPRASTPRMCLTTRIHAGGGGITLLAPSRALCTRCVDTVVPVSSTSGRDGPAAENTFLAVNIGLVRVA